MRADLYLLGYAECQVSEAHFAAFLELCRRTGLVYTPAPHQKGEGGIRFFCRLSLLSRAQALCEHAGIALCVVRRAGLPCLLWRHRRRAGLLVGLLLASLVMLLASRVVWDVRVSGNEQLGTGQLYALLEECGLSVGTWIPTLDTDRIESRVLIESGEVAWISVNLKGTVAQVQIRELMMPQAATDPSPTNLVAACDGVIESVRLLSGQSCVKVGDVVRKGELLVSGVRDSQAYGYRISSAEGQVLAQTEHTISVKLPRISEQKTLAEQKMVEKTLFFFGKAIKITKSTGIVPESCDTIKKMEICSLPTGQALPIRVESTLVRTYEAKQVVLNDEQLYEQAYEQLQRQLSALTAQATLLWQRVSSEITDEGIVLTCRYRCVEDIAKAQPIGTDA